MADLQSFKQDVQSLVRKFEQDKNHYLQKGYPEAQVRIDFLNPFFDALGWDIENKAHKPPHERDVIVELSPETSLRPDYNFRLNGNTKFFVEAKAPWVPLDDVNHIMQAKTYAWSTKEVSFVILTDFEEFKLFDASLKPNPKYPQEGLLYNFKYTEYLVNIEKLWELSKERVTEGSLEAVYDITVRFCDRYVERRSRTHDQMVQAARSGVQNIAEGSQASGTSKKTELKLTNVARASLEELRLDYEDFLRQRGLPLWDRSDPRRSDLIDRRPATADDVAAWVKETR